MTVTATPAAAPVAAKPVTPPAPKPAETRPPAPVVRVQGDDYAKPGVLGTATTVHSVLSKAVGPATKAAKSAGSGAAVGFSGSVGGAIQTFFAAFKAGLKANALMGAAISLVSNGYDAIKGRTSMKQFLGLTAADTVAYTAIGAGSTAVAAAATPFIVGALPALAFAGPVIGIGLALAVGLGGSMLYGKLGHEPLKEALR